MLALTMLSFRCNESLELLLDEADGTFHLLAGGSGAWGHWNRLPLRSWGWQNSCHYVTTFVFTHEFKLNLNHDGPLVYEKHKNFRKDEIPPAFFLPVVWLVV